jgi:hypothetical protein
MSLTSLSVQAGRHFSDRVNVDVFSSATTRRQVASTIAWTLISMVRPSVEQDRLFVVDPRDSDIKRLCSEILGVGAALEVLSRCRVIDGRTIRKLADSFDYQALGRDGVGRLYIEAKGTFNDASCAKHRKSFADKLSGAGLVNSQFRGYSQAIGIIFSVWTYSQVRTYDVELLDPEGEPEHHFDEAVREVIRFYARRLDEVGTLRVRAIRLFELADSPRLLRLDTSTAKLQPGFDDDASHHDVLTVFATGKSQQFIGEFCEAKDLPLPLNLDNSVRYRLSYVGLARGILECIERQQFDLLLSYEAEELLFEVGEGEFKGVFHLDSYGILRGMLTGGPPALTFSLNSSPRAPHDSEPEAASKT